MDIKRVLLVVLSIALIFYENSILIPSCELVPGADDGEIEYEDYSAGGELTVMMLGDLLLSGRKAGFLYPLLTDFFYSRVFKKAFEFVEPNLLIVLGDVSARGAEWDRTEWSPVVQEFHSLMHPFHEVPCHVVLGERDIGECSGLSKLSVDMISRSFPGFGASCWSQFEVDYVNFFSLNSVALLCGNNDLRFCVEKALEAENVKLQIESEHISRVMNDSTGIQISEENFGWRENAMSSRSGPVLLLHFPLYQTFNNSCRGDMYEGTSENTFRGAKASKRRHFVETGQYELSQTLPPNATEYIFQTLRPRMVFSAHAQRFCDCTHPDGTREVIVPAMSWDAGKSPGFVVATFRRNGTVIIINHCKLAGKSRVLLFYASLFFVLILTIQTTLRR